MRTLATVVTFLSLTGCMCRPGVIDCTTGRAYPGYCKPLCGGPGDPFVWISGDCSNCCCGSYRGAYVPYGGRMICGDDMVYGPNCTAPPLRWAAPAVPTPPSGHVVSMPGPVCPPAPAPNSMPPMPPSAPPSERTSVLPSDAAVPRESGPAPMASPSGPAASSGPPALHDARNERPERSRL